MEYKAADALGRSDGKKREITKDISAFANGGGGMIIYGIKEHSDPSLSHLPERIDPVNQSDFSKEWLDQIAGQIQPRIDGLRIIPVHVGPDPSHYCYVVEVPQSGTAHQALDLRYHKRRNFESSAMEDYEIRDISNRRKHPKLSAEVRIISRWPSEGSHIAVRVSNISRVIARDYLVRVQMPIRLSQGYIRPENGRLTNEKGLASWVFGLGNANGYPLFPESSALLHMDFKYFSQMEPDPGPPIPEIRLTFFADEMEKVEQVKPLEAALVDWV